jgi:hypothetical protein
MQTTTLQKTTFRLGLAAGICALLPIGFGATAQTAQDSIKVSKRFFVVTNGTLLVNAVSSTSIAHIQLYLPSGRYLGEVKNGSSKYGGTVFFAGKDPRSLILKSSAGATVTVPTVPYHP